MGHIIKVQWARFCCSVVLQGADSLSSKVNDNVGTKSHLSGGSEGGGRSIRRSKHRNFRSTKHQGYFIQEQTVQQRQ